MLSLEQHDALGVMLNIARDLTASLAASDRYARLLDAVRRSPSEFGKEQRTHRTGQRSIVPVDLDAGVDEQLEHAGLNDVRQEFNHGPLS